MFAPAAASAAETQPEDQQPGRDTVSVDDRSAMEALQCDGEDVTGKYGAVQHLLLAQVGRWGGGGPASVQLTSSAREPVGAWYYCSIGYWASVFHSRRIHCVKFTEARCA